MRFMSVPKGTFKTNQQRGKNVRCTDADRSVAMVKNQHVRPVGLRGWSVFLRRELGSGRISAGEN